MRWFAQERKGHRDDPTSPERKSSYSTAEPSGISANLESSIQREPQFLLPSTVGFKDRSS